MANRMHFGSLRRRCQITRNLTGNIPPPPPEKYHHLSFSLFLLFLSNQFVVFYTYFLFVLFSYSRNCPQVNGTR